MAEILIVDDEIGVRELLTEVLQDEGHSVILAANGAEAREQKKRPSIEVILLDIWMLILMELLYSKNGCLQVFRSQ